jgi:hypothetical protein
MHPDGLLRFHQTFDAPALAVSTSQVVKVFHVIVFLLFRLDFGWRDLLQLLDDACDCHAHILPIERGMARRPYPFLS